jgi:3-oxoacyl-[acyl-carrier-protein] synthase II
VENVVITGFGVACPIGVGKEQAWSSIEAGRSGVRVIQDMAAAGWPAPLGGVIPDDGFDPKEWVQPRKSLKVMAREIQLAFAAGEQSWEAAGIKESAVDPERMGVVFGAGLMYCENDELESAYRACIEDGRFLVDRWGQFGMRQMYPLWMLKYLPNMSASHLGIRRDARGPTNSIAHGDTSSLLALGEATAIIRRGAADVMLTGASSSRMNMLDPLWPEGAEIWRAGIDPAEACRPFDATRGGAVCGEGAAVFTLESERHAKLRQASPIARVASVVSRSEGATATRRPTGRAIEQAIAAAMHEAQLTADDLACVNAHAGGGRLGDAVEAQAIRRALGDVPVTAPKSFFGNSGAAGGAVEMAVGLLAMEQSMNPPTLNYATPDPECPVQVVTRLTPTNRRAVLMLNHNGTGQAVAAVIVAE